MCEFRSPRKTRVKNVKTNDSLLVSNFFKPCYFKTFTVLHKAIIKSIKIKIMQKDSNTSIPFV